MAEARIAVSSWSLHRSLGRPPIYGVEQGHHVPEGHGTGALTLLELPQAIAGAGIQSLEITHFHLPSLDAGYLAELQQALKAAGVELFSLLVDDGDMTHPEYGQRDLDWMARWLPIAEQLGSCCVRVIAGKQAAREETLSLSCERLSDLATRAEALGLRLMTENWFALMAKVEHVRHVLEALEGRVGLCLDFGNWKGEEKYSQFEAIAHYAESCHAKANFEQAVVDAKDYRRCLEITHRADFQGPYTLIFDSDAPDEWQGLAAEKAIVTPFL